MVKKTVDCFLSNELINYLNNSLSLTLEGAKVAWVWFQLCTKTHFNRHLLFDVSLWYLKRQETDRFYLFLIQISVSVTVFLGPFVKKKKKQLLQQVDLFLNQVWGLIAANLLLTIDTFCSVTSTLLHVKHIKVDLNLTSDEAASLLHLVAHIVKVAAAPLRQWLFCPVWL